MVSKLIVLTLVSIVLVANVQSSHIHRKQRSGSLSNTYSSQENRYKDSKEQKWSENNQQTYPGQLNHYGEGAERKGSKSSLKHRQTLDSSSSSSSEETRQKNRYDSFKKVGLITSQEELSYANKYDDMRQIDPTVHRHSQENTAQGRRTANYMKSRDDRTYAPYKDSQEIMNALYKDN